MKSINFEALDLNLFRVFEALILERNVTRAGERLGQSQPAVSRALSQLRYVFKDELFIRSAGLMVPTPLAAEMGVHIHRVLQQLRDTLTLQEFTPANSTRCFNIVCGDYSRLVLMPFILNRLRVEAPGIQLNLRHFDADNVKDLDEGNIDLIISDFRNIPERFVRDSLIEDELVGVMRKGHPMDKEVIDDVMLLKFPYVAIDIVVVPSSQNGAGLLTLRGLEQWTSRDYSGHGGPSPGGTDMAFLQRLSVPTQLAAIMLVASTDYITVLPRRLVRIMQTKADLRIFEIPEMMRMEPARLSIGMLWHRMQGGEPAHSWLRDLFRQSAAAALNREPTGHP